MTSKNASDPLQLELYNKFAQDTARRMTVAYSTSFSSASSLFDKSIRQDIYNIYGLVRLADEIVDTYSGPNQIEMLDRLESDTYASLQTGYSTNLIVQAFIITAQKFNIEADLIAPFFESMRTDSRDDYKPSQYQQYIYGSAEVVGLMCLSVFVDGQAERFDKLKPGACALGAAFQKVNFLRDMAADFAQLGRYYFPTGSFDKFDELCKAQIVDDIRQDFAVAKPAIMALPKTARPAVSLAFRYYLELLKKLHATPAEVIKQQRVRVGNINKLRLLATVKASHRFKS